ncbi:hypothetical protein ECC07_01270 [Helicobacter pylori]|nr:hypothetical protein ECC07_01270 [Helicobacter pylori]
MQRENSIRGSKSSNLRSSNFLMRSLRSLTQFKSSSLLGGGVEAAGFGVFGFSIFSLFVFSTI